MSVKQRNAANARKEAMKTVYVARLVDNPTSPRKTRIMANVILKSAIANWQVKNEGKRLEDADLYVKTIMVDGGRMLKRIRTAPQGRAARIRKRSNHVTLILGDRNEENMPAENIEESQK